MSALLDCAPYSDVQEDEWVSYVSPRRPAARPLEDLVAERKAKLRAIANNMTDQKREGDLAAMANEHEEFATLRQRANGEILD